MMTFQNVRIDLLTYSEKYISNLKDLKDSLWDTTNEVQRVAS